MAFLASCSGTTDNDGGTTQPSFTYSSGVTAEFGMAQDAASSAPTWTNLPAGTVTYSIAGPPGGSKLNVTPTVGSDGVVTVPKDAHAAAEDWTVTAAAGDSAYTAKITITVNPKEHTIGTVSYTAITASKDVEITPVRPSFTDALPSGAAAVYTVAPALPAGLDLNPATGEITGTPAAEQAETEHTVTLTLTGNYTGSKDIQVTLNVLEAVVYNLGDTGPAGGKIFYVNTNAASDGWTYLEAASQDHDVTVQWGGAGTVNTGTAIGSGKANTEAIVGALGDNEGTAYAAKICSEYTVNNNGVDYDDWFLPSKDELNELYEQKDSVGGFVSNSYWSSSESSALAAWGQGLYFDNSPGSQFYAKYTVFNVRAVRAF